MMATVAPPPAIYAGVREIETGGTWYGELSPARYDVTETYATARWQGRVATLHGTIVYRMADHPTTGIFLTEATIDQEEQVNTDGSVRLLSAQRVTRADDVRGTTSSFFRRSADIAFDGGQTIIPMSLKPHREVLPLGGTLHRTEWDRGGVAGGSYAELDLRRTTHADGSFEEDGSSGIGNMHHIRQQANGSATAYDGIPGFGVSDTTIDAPEGTGHDARVAVTVKSQGRTIGPTPFVTHGYVVPVWYATTWPAPLATATLTVENPRSPDARCTLGTAPLVPVVIERMQVEVTGRIVEERDERDLDRARRVLCHLTSTTTRRYDDTTGSVTGAIIDTTVVHMTGRPSRA